MWNKKRKKLAIHILVFISAKKIKVSNEIICEVKLWLYLLIVSYVISYYYSLLFTTAVILYSKLFYLLRLFSITLIAIYLSS